MESIDPNSINIVNTTNNFDRGGRFLTKRINNLMVVFKNQKYQSPQIEFMETMEKKLTPKSINVSNKIIQVLSAQYVDDMDYIKTTVKTGDNRVRDVHLTR